MNDRYWQDNGSAMLTPADADRLVSWGCTARVVEHATQCDTCGQQPQFCDCNRFDRDDQFEGRCFLLGEERSTDTHY